VSYVRCAPLLSQLAVGLFLGAIACGREAPFDDRERRNITASVDSAVRRFEAAQRDRNAEQAIALMAPRLLMFQVRVLSEHSALASFRFRDSLVTIDGATVRVAGATTLLWERTDGRWLMTYGHADHHPVP
jgi:hypothetical protein